MEFHKIVVAFDGSKDAAKAVEAARALASGLGSELVLVHVYTPPMMAYTWPIGAPAVDSKELEAAARKGGEATLASGLELAAAGGVKARGELVEAPTVVQALVDFLANEHADLLVVGTRGMTGFKKLVMGSVSSGLVGHSPCPVLVVR